jgi:hypothetical protein
MVLQFLGGNGRTAQALARPYQCDKAKRESSRAGPAALSGMPRAVEKAAIQCLMLIKKSASAEPWRVFLQ